MDENPALLVEEGAHYRTRAGHVVGPMQRRSQALHSPAMTIWPWKAEGWSHWHRDDGTVSLASSLWSEPYDLVEKVSPSNIDKLSERITAARKTPAASGSARPSMTLAEFHNGLRILLNLDRHVLVEGGVLRHADHNAWGTFTRDPYRFFIRADDATAEKLWTLMQTRMRPCHSE